MESLDEGGGSVRRRRIKDDSNVFGPATPSVRVDFRGRPGLHHLHGNWDQRAPGLWGPAASAFNSDPVWPQGATTA